MSNVTFNSDKSEIYQALLDAEEEIGRLRARIEVLMEAEHTTPAIPVLKKDRRELTKAELEALPSRVKALCQYIGWRFRVDSIETTLALLKELVVAGGEGHRVISFNKEFYRNNPEKCRKFLESLGRLATVGRWRMTGAGLEYRPAE